MNSTSYALRSTLIHAQAIVHLLAWTSPFSYPDEWLWARTATRSQWLNLLILCLLCSL